jgi:hypothetical protein
VAHFHPRWWAPSTGAVADLTKIPPAQAVVKSTSNFGTLVLSVFIGVNQPAQYIPAEVRHRRIGWAVPRSRTMRCTIMHCDLKARAAPDRKPEYNESNYRTNVPLPNREALRIKK